MSIPIMIQDMAEIVDHLYLSDSELLSRTQMVSPGQISARLTRSSSQFFRVYARRSGE
ncbi:hypothetical protein P0R31_37525 [Bradyrhizobium yuanmingense]|uniref:hypothetical protein n=1 Tax=Bradyrhizobium yuanmingense TaxID=108015 RepID=UPI0023B9A787|nr:hypothetical protein [Bradyrhizobium yuanmingense]MDF0522933.1 hypothetical protein [Bradyrhizobium yuanmingense]